MAENKHLGKGLGALLDEKAQKYRIAPSLKDYIDLEYTFHTKRENLKDLEIKLKEMKEQIFFDSIKGKIINVASFHELERKVKDAKKELEEIKKKMLNMKNYLYQDGVLNVISPQQFEIIKRIENVILEDEGIDKNLTIKSEDIPLAQETKVTNTYLKGPKGEIKSGIPDRNFNKLKTEIEKDLEKLIEPQLMEAFDNIDKALHNLIGGEGIEDEEEFLEEIEEYEPIEIDEIDETQGVEGEIEEVDMEALREEIHPKAVSRRIAIESGIRAQQEGGGEDDLDIHLNKDKLKDMSGVDVIERSLKLIKENKLQKAEKILLDYVKYEPQTSWIWYYLGGIYLLMEDINKAHSALQKAHGMNIHNPKIMLRLADVLSKMQKRTEALKLIKEVLKMNPKNTVALTIAGEIFLYKGKYGHAKKYISIALKSDPKNERARKDMRILERMEGENT